MNTRRTGVLGWILTTFASILLATGLAAAWGSIVHGSVLALPALARGHVVLAEPASRSLGPLHPGVRVKAEFSLKNLTSEPIAVNGIDSDCTCVSGDALPLVIPPHARRSFRLWVRPLESQAGTELDKHVNLLLSTRSQVELTVHGVVSKSH